MSDPYITDLHKALRAAEERAATAERELELSEQDAEIQRTAAVEWFDRCEAAEADAARLRTALVKMHRWAVGPEPESDEERDAYFADVREADAALESAPPIPERCDYQPAGLTQCRRPAGHDDLHSCEVVESAPPIPRSVGHRPESHQERREFS